MDYLRNLQYCKEKYEIYLTGFNAAYLIGSFNCESEWTHFVLTYKSQKEWLEKGNHTRQIIRQLEEKNFRLIGSGGELWDSEGLMNTYVFENEILKIEVEFSANIRIVKDMPSCTNIFIPTDESNKNSIFIYKCLGCLNLLNFSYISEIETCKNLCLIEDTIGPS